MSIGSAATPPSATATAAFARVVCGVDDSRAAAAAARQAATLATPGGAVMLVAVARTVGFGPTRMADLSPARAELRLEQLRHEVDHGGVRVTTSLIDAEHAAPAILEAAADADLIAVGARPGGRPGGIAAGSTSSVLLHRAPISVLVARSSAGDRPFAERALVASDGSAASRAAVRAAAALVLSQGTDVVMVQPDYPDVRQRRRLATDAAILAEAMGKEPVILSEQGRPHVVIARLATTVEASLIILGSRGLRGVAALGSVSERVAHKAPCSVLVVRPGPAPTA